MHIRATGWLFRWSDIGCFGLKEEEPETKSDAYFTLNYITKMVKNDMKRKCIKMARLVGLSISQLALITMTIVTIVYLNSGISEYKSIRI